MSKSPPPAGRRPLGWAGLLLIPILLIACDRPKVDEYLRPLTLQTGTLTVVTRNIPTAYYYGPEGETGFEYDLVRALANDLGLKLKLIVAGSVSEMLAIMAGNRADLAAGGLTRTPERERCFTFGPDYYPVRQQLVYRRGMPHPHNFEELQKYEPLILARSSYVERLRELKKHYPGLHWRTTNDFSTDQLLEQVWEKELGLTVADSNILAINRRFYPELEIAFPLGPKQTLAWIINPRLSRLRHRLKKWFPEIIADGRWDEIRERYYSHVEFFDYVDIKVFTRRIRTLLPAYRPLFEKYGSRYRLPWTLLAAKAYQESHWNPLATSPTGVRGIMMLTETTAVEMGVENRLDPEQSIRGGAAYFRKLLDRVPAGYHGHDRWNVALAAYNVGLGHIYDARRLARQRGRNPNFWLTLKEVLPLLSQERYYKRLPYGYARGIEPVLYVTRVNNYREILEKQLTITARRRQHRKPTPALAQALPAKP